MSRRRSGTGPVHVTVDRRPGVQGPRHFKVVPVPPDGSCLPGPCRESLVARKKAKGVFRQYLADHAGWFELTLEVNDAAAATGFEITKPEVVRDN